MENFSLKIRNYKCFAGEEQGFDRILPINLIIGRNNSGKSALLDLVEYATKPKLMGELEREHRLWHAGSKPQVVMRSPLTEAEARRVFGENTSGGGIPGRNHWEYGRGWVGKKITWTFDVKGQHIFVDSEKAAEQQIKLPDKVATAKQNLLLGWIFKRLLSDRDIAPEEDISEPSVQKNGEGATNTVQHFINKIALPSELVEQTLLKELNRIFEPDSSFTDIVVQQLVDDKWEILLEEATKGRVAISQSGSGLKTILLVLVFLHLIPRLEQKKLRVYTFAFEELENNLHPALQRRLLLYLRDVALEHGCIFFLSTHSNVVIDLFSTDENAQIIHVTHDGEVATTKRVDTYIDNRGVLDDLDVRASDLLQANGIIWVEGPSDRLYVNRWIEIWSEGELREGAHYQCVFYGGRLLAHLDANEPEEETANAVQMLRVNRNAAILIDSDMSAAKQEVNKTKRRIIQEIEDIGGLAWVTEGKEVENYIPRKAIQALYPNKTVDSAIQKYGAIDKYLDRVSSGEGKRFLRNKVVFAEKVRRHINKENIEGRLDLAKKLDELCKQIKRWNSM